MCKVDEKWLKANGWTCWVDETTQSWDYSTKTITHHTVYVKSVATKIDSAVSENPLSPYLGDVYVWKLSPGVSDQHERFRQSFQSALIESGSP